jgi:YHS domain-containing protein
MADTSALASRIDSQIADAQQRIAAFQKSAEQEYLSREKRYQEQYLPAVARLVELIKPRLQVLADRFKDKVQVSPTVTAHQRQVTYRFDARIARIELTFRVSHDADVRNLVFDQNLEVLPILMQFEKHSSLSVPLDKVDDAKVLQWVDDRIVAFVQTFLEIHQNRYYQKDILVTDPVAGVEMPKFAAKCSLESGGKTYYFVSEETRREFESQQRGKA